MKHAAIFLAILTGCAQAPDRFVTDKQDAALAKACAAGCAVIPAPIWIRILQRLQGQGV